MDEFTYLLEESSQNKILEPQIQNIFKRINQAQDVLDQKQKHKKQTNEKYLLESFKKAITKVGQQLLQAKRKYNEIDKQKLIQQKCMMLSEKLNRLRLESFQMNSQILKINKQIARVEQKNIRKQFQIGCLKQALKNKTKMSRINKNIYITNLQQKRRFSQPTFFPIKKEVNSINNQTLRQLKSQYTLNNKIEESCPTSLRDSSSMRRSNLSSRRKYKAIKIGRLLE